MHLDWILQPVISYVFTAAGIGLCLFLFVSLKRDLQACDARSAKKCAALETEWTEKLAVLQALQMELSQASDARIAPAPTRSGMNLKKRSQALQLSRRGESTQEIAAALSLPQNEVELLIKVQRIALSGLEGQAARASAG
jgi:hypothetical protein